MDTLSLIKKLVAKDTSIADSLLDSIDSYAREVSVIDYGLPQYDSHQDALRLIVLRWVLSLEEGEK